MQCPLHDGELVSHTTQGENNLTISYSTCPTCHGYWMDSFAANFIKLPASQLPVNGTPSSTTFFCPVCSVALTRTTGNNIPDNVYVYDCPRHHGYFFPTGQLAAFKNAQHAKINYYKIWNIPMPNIAHILLASVILLILASGLLTAFVELQQRQITESQAQQLLVNHAAYPSPNATSVLITATTGVDTTVTVHIPEMNEYTGIMKSTDKRTHQLTVTNIASGTYHYFFTFKVAGKEQSSDTYSFQLAPRD